MIDPTSFTEAEAAAMESAALATRRRAIASARVALESLAADIGGRWYQAPCLTEIYWEAEEDGREVEISLWVPRVWYDDLEWRVGWDDEHSSGWASFFPHTNEGFQDAVELLRRELASAEVIL